MVSARAACLIFQNFSNNQLPISAINIFLPLPPRTFTMNMHSISRAAERRSLSLTVKGRVKSRPVYVDLIDISEGGCKIRGSAGFANVGDRVTMKVDGVNAPLGTIAWIEGKVAGVSFEGQMHAAVVDHLVHAQGTKLGDDSEDHRRKL